MDHFQVVHINVRGVRANKDNLISYLNEKNFPHILTINETKIGLDQCVSIPHYDCVVQKGNRPYGSLILKRKDVLNVTALEDFGRYSEEVIGIRLHGDQ